MGMEVCNFGGYECKKSRAYVSLHEFYNVMFSNAVLACLIQNYKKMLVSFTIRGGKKFDF